MNVTICKNKSELGSIAAGAGAEHLRAALARQAEANIILATGASQFEMLAALLEEPDIDWSRVRIFHLDEYIGLPPDHPAGFRNYLWNRFVSKLPVPPAAFYPVNGSNPDPEQVCRTLGTILSEHPIDVAFIGIGENGHIAFNDPPADFDTGKEYLVIRLEELCRQQQQGEGWFETLKDVPEFAISMSCKQILKSKAIVCTVPDARKAQAVKGALEGSLTTACPASILRTHGNIRLFLDPASASLLETRYDESRLG